MRVGLAPGLAALSPGTGHGTAWASVLDELRSDPAVKLVQRGRADVWLASGHAPPPDGRPLVVQVHEASWADPTLRRILHPEFAAAIDTATHASVAAAARVITPSGAARRQVIDAYGRAPDDVHAVPHGVDHHLFRPGLDLEPGLVATPYVLFVAVLHPRKNFAAVREAVAGLARAGLPHRLAIVGNPAADPNAKSYERQAAAELRGFPGRVRLLRGLPVATLAALMARADVFCLPSLFEGFGLPALEAMACGTPVVVSDRGALPEVVGGAGLVVSPDQSAVADAVRRVVSDPALAARLRATAVVRAAQFSWRRTAAGWLAVLRAAA
jgi:glycosyltransferase involved in cell wall biosynthesis